MEEKTIVFPPGQKKDNIDYNIIYDLAVKSAVEILDYIKCRDIPNERKRIFRWLTSSIDQYEVLLPQYYDRSLLQESVKFLYTDTSSQLTSYLWEKSIFKTPITGKNPERRNWEYHVIFELIFKPLVNAIQRFQVKSFVFDKIVQSNINSIDVNDIKDSIKLSINKLENTENKLMKFFGFCLLATPEISERKEIDLGSNIKINSLSKEEFCIYLSEYYNLNFHQDLQMPIYNRVLVEIETDVAINDDGSSQIIGITEKLDILKWAIMVTTQNDLVIGESSITLLDGNRRKISSIRRSNTPIFGSRAILDSSKILEIENLINDYNNALSLKEDISNAMWHFGRASVSSLERDILLESSMGLDSILVPGGGDSKYKFCLHGKAVLSKSGYPEQADYQTFEKIYNERSNAAHGRLKQIKKGKKEINNLDKQARLILANTINGIIKLSKKGHINFSKRENIALAVQDFVINSF